MINKKIFILMTTLMTFLPKSGQASLESDVQAIIKKHHLSESNLGLYIEDNGEKLIQVNAEKLMIPASLTKIVTGGAVLQNLSLGQKFKTELWSKGKIENEKAQVVLKGSLCLKGGGDPSFVSEKMWFLVNELTRSQLKMIDGDLLVDSSRFDEELFDVGRDSVRVDRAFDAPISAMSFNWNSVNVFIRPSKAGEKLNVFLDPQTDYFELDNKTKTVAKNGVNSIDVSRVKTSRGDKIIVTGSLSANSKEIVIYKSISHPAIWSGEHLKQFLSQRGITLKGQIKQASCEEGSSLLASVSSKNLNEMTSDMLKFSNNFVAEMLVKNLAAEQKNAPHATMKEGIEILKSYLDQVGLNRKDYNLVNVSGLTRDNQFSAKQLADVLINIKNNFLIYPEFLSALPIPGVDGTMKNRLKNDDGKWVRAKTGYLDGVVGLAGYIGRKNKGPLVFVFLFNGGYDQGLASRAFFDDIILKVINQ